MQEILSLDHQLFLWINHWPHAPFSDFIAILLSAGSGFFWFFIIGLIFIFEHHRKTLKSLSPLITAAVLTYVFIRLILKPFFGRLRPDITNNTTVSVPSMIDSLWPFPLFGGDFSFPSGHATMAFAGAFIFSRIHPKGKIGFYFLAILISLSRIYLGKHYPLDIIGGIVVGTFIGWLSFWLVKQLYWYSKVFFSV